MMNGSLLRLFTLEYDAKTNSISPHVGYISPDNVLQDLYKVLKCELVTCVPKLKSTENSSTFGATT